MIEQLQQFSERVGPIITAIIVFVGILKLMRWVFHTSKFIKRNFFTKGLDLFKRYDGENSWAVVTGGSDGIGLEMSRRFARLGFNVCLIARTLSKLESAEKEL